jgi:cold-inducible RNA-binding protein
LAFARRFFLHIALAFGSCRLYEYPGDRCLLIPAKDRTMNIFVGNLAFTATEEAVRQLFATYGAVDNVNIITDRETGRPRGFGFVEMPDSKAAKAAIAGLQGTDLGGRTLNINEAKPREPRRESRGPRW